MSTRDWLEHECPGNGDALLLTTREFTWTAVPKVFKANHGQCLANALCPIGRGDAPNLQRERQGFVATVMFGKRA